MQIFGKLQFNNTPSIGDRNGGAYRLVSEYCVFHMDFMSELVEGKLEHIIDSCDGIEVGGKSAMYNHPCNCEQFQTENDNLSSR